MQLLLRKHQKLRMRRINVRDLVLCGPYRSLVISSLSVAAIGAPAAPPPAHQLIWLSQVTPVCRSQKLLTSQATTLVTRDSEPPYLTDAVSAFDGKVFVRDVYRDVTYDAINIKFWHNGPKIVRRVCLCAKFDISAVTRYGDITRKHLGANRHLPT